MNNDRLEALLWARFDGTIELEELVELEAHLAEHPLPREIERQITTIAEELERLEPEEPPAVLRQRIDEALAHATSPKARTDHPTTPGHTLSMPAKPAQWLPLAATLLIGVAIGYLLHPGAGGSIDQSEVTGTMVTPPAQVVTVPVEILLDAGSGSVIASRVGADVVVDVVLSAEIDLAVTVAGTGGPVHFRSLSSSDGPATEVTTEHGWVVARMNGPGSATLSVSATDADDPLRLQVSSAGFPVGERWIGSGRNEATP